MSSRFYTADGTCIEGLRAARKLSPLPVPSVSTVLSLIVSPGLVRYFEYQMFLAAVTTPRQPGWTDDQYFKACDSWAAEHGQKARDAGTELHDLIQSYNLARLHQKPIPRPPERWAGQYGSYVGWYEANVEKTLAVEEVLFGDGYAGRVDHVYESRDGRIFVGDAKTQNLVNKKKFSHYLSWAMQLGAYAGAYNVDSSGLLTTASLISLCFDPNSNAFEAYEWPNSPRYYLNLFLGLIAVWKEEHSYHSGLVNGQKE